MFEEYSKPHPKKRRLTPAQGAAIAVSTVVHVLLLYALYHGKITIKFLPAFQNVRNVVIGPSLKGSAQVVMGSQGSESGEPRTGGAAPPGVSTGGRAAAAALEDATASSSAPSLSRPFSLRTEPEGTPVPALSEEFYQSLLSRARPRTRSGLIITFAPPGAQPAPPLKADLREHLFPGQPGVGGRAEGSPDSRGGVSGRQRAGISIPLEDYDLTPWAEQVIALIQKNWDLPLVRTLPSNARVRILTVITKSGSLSSFELLISSSLASLDQAAVRAIRASLPFPPLPGDFPADLLEAFFEFTYND